MTGGASGLGRAVVNAFVREGARVVAVDKDAERGAAAAEEAVASGGEVRFLAGDVGDEATIVRAIDLCCAEFGSLSILHNNAARQVEALLHETENDDIEEMLTVNLKATIWGCKHAVRRMLKDAKRGSIINTSSLVAITADPLIPVYGATKAGILGLTRGVAVTYADQGIRCNAICPGDMDTPLLQKYLYSTPDPAAARRALEDASPIKRLADPAEVAEAVVFLASRDASFVTGASLLADGGLSIKTY